MTTALRQPAVLKDMLTGIFFCLLIIAVMHMIPLLGIFAWVVLPLPVIFFRLKTGRLPSSIIMAFCLLLLIVITGNILFNVVYFGTLLTTGFFLGEFIEKHLPVERVMLYTGAAVASALLIIFLLSALVQGKTIISLFSGYISQYQILTEQIFTDSSKLYPQMQMSPDDFKRVSSLFAVIFPGILIDSYLTMVWINILLIKRLLKNRGIVVKSIENLNQWKAPFFLVFGVIGSSILTFVVTGALKYIAINCLIIILFVYFFQGMAVVSFFFQKKSAPYALRIFIYLLIAVQPLFLAIVIGFGLFDTWANFRKIDITV